MKGAWGDGKLLVRLGQAEQVESTSFGQLENLATDTQAGNYLLIIIQSNNVATLAKHLQNIASALIRICC